MYTPHYPHLCSPIKIGKLTLRHRMCSAPLGYPELTEDGCLTEGAIAFYERRAKGGAAVVTVSEALPDYKNGNSHTVMINLENPKTLFGLANAALAIKRHGAVASIELGHSGAFAGGLTDSAAGQSAKKAPRDYISDFSLAQIESTVAAYGRAAAYVKQAGFDMITLHAGHGWLIHQFLSPAVNHRTDAYGGSPEKRAQFALDLIRAIRAAVGPDFPIEVRMSAYETLEGGVKLEDAVAFAKIIDDEVDLIHVSAGGTTDFHSTHPSMFQPSAINAQYAAEIKKHVRTPVAVVGMLNEPDEMEKIIASGAADIVVMARALMADPDLPNKVMQNREDEIVRCMRCLLCHAERAKTQTRICALNPVIGREYEAKFDLPASTPKKVLVVGGGPGGLQCALTAAERGHTVTLCEKEDKLGGQLRCEFHVPFKSAFPKYVEVMQRRLERAGVTIRLNTEVTPDFVRAFEPDALMIAVGAEPLMLPIEGLDSSHVVRVVDLETQEDRLGRRVVVLGGGLAGCESGVYLGGKGHAVTIVEMRDDVAVDANPRHRPALMRELEKYTTVRTGLKAVAVRPEGLLCRDADGNEILIEADSILYAAGLVSRTEVADSLRGLAPIVSVFGDCVRPGIIRGATFFGYHAALDI